MPDTRQSLGGPHPLYMLNMQNPEFLSTHARYCFCLSRRYIAAHKYIDFKSDLFAVKFTQSTNALHF